MSDFETPIMRDVYKLIIVIGVGILIGLGILITFIYIIPSINQYNDFIENNECLYFKEIQKTLCGQDAIEHINNGVLK